MVRTKIHFLFYNTYKHIQLASKRIREKLIYTLHGELSISGHTLTYPIPKSLTPQILGSRYCLQKSMSLFTSSRVTARAFNLSGETVSASINSTQPLHRRWDRVMAEKKEPRPRVACPDCGSQRLVEDPSRGEVVCSNCGLVIDTIMDTGPEWRAYSAVERQERARTGAPFTPLKAELGLRTQISDSGRDSLGRSLTPDTRYKFRRLSRIDDRTRKSEVRNLRLALKELKRIRSQLDLPEDVAETASNYYRKALRRNLIRGRSIDCMITGSLYLACRKKGIPLTLKDIAGISDISPKELGRCIRILLTELNIRATPSSLIALVHRLGGSLDVNMEARRRAVEILEQAQKAGVTIGKNPMSMAAAALYISAIQTGERKTQQEIAKVAKTTPVTIRNRFKELIRVLGLDGTGRSRTA